jgi:hypothetical protein
MVKWEYAFINISAFVKIYYATPGGATEVKFNSTNSGAFDQMAEALAKMGAEGWELIPMQDLMNESRAQASRGTGGSALWFKRPV